MGEKKASEELVIKYNWALLQIKKDLSRAVDDWGMQFEVKALLETIEVDDPAESQSCLVKIDFSITHKPTSKNYTFKFRCNSCGKVEVCHSEKDDAWWGIDGKNIFALLWFNEILENAFVVQPLDEWQDGKDG